LGQVEGAVTIGFPEAMIAARRLAMEQWCAPLRRQQAGKLASSSPSAAAKGPRRKTSMSKNETLRRIWELVYMSGLWDGAGGGMRSRYSVMIELLQEMQWNCRMKRGIGCFAPRVKGSCID
jgi:hypothetical protein